MPTCAPPRRSSPHVGPVGGGTHVAVRAVIVDGSGEAGASDPRCRFGAAEVEATAAGDVLRCATPPRGGAAGEVAVGVALNGQQWAEDVATFTYVACRPPSRACCPTSRPTAAASCSSSRATRRRGGHDYRWRFGPPAQPAAAVAATVAATLDDGAGSVLCVSPPGFLGRVAVGVTLNGQQYTAASAGAQLTYYDVDSVGGLSAIAADALPRPTAARELNAALFPDFSDDERRLPPRPEYPHADPHADSFPDYSAMFPASSGTEITRAPPSSGTHPRRRAERPSTALSAEDLPWTLEDWRYRRGDPFQTAIRTTCTPLSMATGAGSATSGRRRSSTPGRGHLVAAGR